MPVLIKICGLNTLHSLQASLKAGADMIGLVFHPKSPRFTLITTSIEKGVKYLYRHLSLLTSALRKGAHSKGESKENQELICW